MKKVVAYARVSTHLESQENSYKSQQLYFEKYINNNKDWQLVRIYSDEVSGTSTRKRKDFNEMIRDAECGIFDIILTKEVSRFARNTLDTLQYTRKLKAMGIDVYFLLDNISTADKDGELRLTIFRKSRSRGSKKVFG